MMHKVFARIYKKANKVIEVWIALFLALNKIL
jgi:hypothetical protein